MATEFSRGIAAKAWAQPNTSNIDMDPWLAEAFADILDRYIEALQWCGGSDDFQLEGKARVGWEKMVLPLIRSPKND